MAPATTTAGAGPAIRAIAQTENFYFSGVPCRVIVPAESAGGRSRGVCWTRNHLLPALHNHIPAMQLSQGSRSTHGGHGLKADSDIKAAHDLKRFRQLEIKGTKWI